MPNYFDTRPKPPLTPTKPLVPFTPFKFTPFPKLPSELRLNIWRHALPKARTIVITHRPHPNHDPIWQIISAGWLDFAFPYHQHDPTWQQSAPTIHYKSPTPHPTLLSVCREARYEVLKYYIIIHGPHGFCVAFDNEVDTIYASYGQTGAEAQESVSLKFFSQPDFKILNQGKGAESKGTYDKVVRIKSLAVHESHLEGGAFQLAGLKRLTVVRPLQTPAAIIVIGSDGQEEGEAVRNFKMEMEAWVRRKREGSVPDVKVVMGCFKIRSDPYAVRITPLSLRKEDM